MSIDRVEVTKLGKRFGLHRALAKVELEFRAGSVSALLGPNGAGKSTLLGILATLVRPSTGKVVYEYQGKALKSGNSLRREIGVLAHDSFLYGNLSAVENLHFYGELYGIGALESKIVSLLEEVGLDEKARERKVETYSRGMSQRAALARALLADPALLLLDEPFTGLDQQGIARLAASIVSAKQSGKVVVVVTHDLEALDGIVDHVVVLHRGACVHEERAEAYSGAQLKEIYHQFVG